jgi:hypothetical protein
MKKAMTQANVAGESIANGDVSPENMVSLDEASVEMKANAVTLRVADEMIGTLLNQKA